MGASEGAESLRDSDALMRVAVPLERAAPLLVPALYW